MAGLLPHPFPPCLMQQGHMVLILEYKLFDVLEI